MKYNTILKCIQCDIEMLEIICERLPKTRNNYPYKLLLEESIRSIKYKIDEKLLKIHNNYQSSILRQRGVIKNE